MGMAVRSRRDSYRARIRIDLSCVAEAQIFHDCNPNIHLSGISGIFRFRCKRQVVIACTVPRARHHRSFERRDNTRMGSAEVLGWLGKALEFGDGNEVTKIARLQLPNSINADKASQGTRRIQNRELNHRADR